MLWVLPAFWGTASFAPAEETIFLDMDEPAATATPLPAALPTKTPTPVPLSTPLKAPAPKAAPTPLPAAVPETVPPDLSQEPEHARRLKLYRQLGFMDHPIVWLVADGNYARALQSADPSIANGFGMDLRLEIQFFTWLSLGTYYNFTVFPATGRLVLTGPLGLIGRVFPMGLGKKGDFNPYVMVGGGLNSVVAQNKPEYPDNFQTFGGVGAQYGFGDHWGMDVGVVYNFYVPGASLQTVSGRIGLDYSFNP